MAPLHYQKACSTSLPLPSDTCCSLKAGRAIQAASGYQNLKIAAAKSLVISSRPGKFWQNDEPHEQLYVESTFQHGKKAMRLTRRGLRRLRNLNPNHRGVQTEQNGLQENTFHGIALRTPLELG
jgi:hypothetical protein